MSPVDVGVRHDKDLVVAKLFFVEIIPHTGSQCQDDVSYRLASEYFFHARLLNVEDLAPQRQYRLKLAVAPLFGASTGAVSLDDVELTVLRISV